MAGQPQEPPWAPQGQSQPPAPPQAQDPAQPAWQGYVPPGSAQQDYGYSQGTAAPGYGPVYTEQAQPHAEQAQPPYAEQGQRNQTKPFSAPDHGSGQEQGVPQFRQAKGRRAQGQSKSAEHAKGFLAALFDFGFTSFVTPKILKVLYVLVTVWTVIWALIFLRLGFHYGGLAGGLATLIIVDPILILLTLGVYRVVLEFFMIMFRMHEDLKALRDRRDGLG